MGAVRKRGTRVRVCVDCGKVETVRQDNTGVRCRSCSIRLSGLAAARSPKKSPPPISTGRRLRWVSLTCAACRNPFERPPSSVRPGARLFFCSMDCRRSHAKVRRTCKCCGIGFEVARGVLSGKTNASGNFCSRPCYERWLCQTDRVSGRGSQWRKIRRAVLDRFPFCGWCGTLNRSRLQVHHIVPFRISNDNSPKNLIPLCVSCHRRIETVTVEVEALGGGAAVIFGAMALQLRQRQAATAVLLSRFANDNSKFGNERASGQRGRRGSLRA